MVERLDSEKHDVAQVAQLIYQTDAQILPFVFGKDEKKAVRRIEKLIRMGRNTFGSEHLTVLTEKNFVQGILVGFTAKEKQGFREKTVFPRVFGVFGSIRLLFVMTVLGNLISLHFEPYDYHISNLSVRADCRGKGFGSILLCHAIQQAREKGCKRVVLDVNTQNPNALRLYEKNGFRIAHHNRSKFLPISCYTMQLYL